MYSNGYHNQFTDVPTYMPEGYDTVSYEDRMFFPFFPSQGGGQFGQPSSPPPFGPPGQGPQGEPPFGPPGQGPQAGPPMNPPPSTIPQSMQLSQSQDVSTFAVDPGSIRGCLYRYTYVRLSRFQQFWFYPNYVGRRSVAGYRWNGFRWVYFGIDLERIQSFSCL